MKKQNGITLIALVITIIVLLILAGITIAMLTGENGLLTKANSAKVTDLEAKATEQLRLAVAAMNLELQQEKVKNSSYDPIETTGAPAAMRKILTDDLIPNTDWDIPAATDFAEETTIKYQNAEYKAAHNNTTKDYTITFTANGITLSEN
jgi:type II secretory pathway pseudopilin PulG